ncbi:MAG: thioredoxin-disulfide reductase [Acidimicrobiia bacterium]
MHTKVLILGSGPGGLTAAIYASRANLDPVVVEGTSAGGQLMITTEVENFPGFPSSVTGPELITQMREQAERFGTTFVSDDVTAIDFSSSPRVASTSTGEIEFDSLVITTGASARWLGIESEQRLQGHGVSACATCDGFFFRDKVVAVVGGGDTAIEEALFLTRFASEVIVIHRRDELRASKIMQDRALKHPKISFQWNKEVVEVLGTGTITGVELSDTQTGDHSTLEVGGLFIAIGHIPNTALFTEALELDPQGYIVTKPDSTHTSLEGVFAAGDVQDKVFRQAITAAGTGCMAAIEAERWLEARGE